MVEILQVSVRVYRSGGNSRSHKTNFPYFCLADDLFDIVETFKEFTFFVKKQFSSILVWTYEEQLTGDEPVLDPFDDPPSPRDSYEVIGDKRLLSI